MKNTFMVAGAALLSIATVSCSSEKINPGTDKNEEYVREFVTNFGVPAQGHSYAMARAAGLKVTTEKGGHVTVTAQVDGKEYLFADLDVPAGTHALPVTIPSSVKELKVAAATGVHVVPADATVDIDKPGAGNGRSYYNVDDTDNDMEMGFTIMGEGGDPYLLFQPQHFMSFQKHIDKYLAADGDNTDTTLPEVRVYTNTRGEIVKYFIDNPHETALTCVGGEYDYYIFPVWWQRNKKGKQDYEVYFHKVHEGTNEMSSLTRMEFGEPGSSSAYIPFPEMYYTNYNGDIAARVDVENKTFTNPSTGAVTNFVKPTGALTRAFVATSNISSNLTRWVLTRGKKIHMKRYTDEDKNHYFPAFAIAIKSNISKDNYSFVSSAPFYNAPFWNGNYYDVPLDRLYQANVATKRVNVDRRSDDNKAVSQYVYDPDLDITDPEAYGNHGTWWSQNTDKVHSYSGQFLSMAIPDSPFLLGFCSPADEPGDGSDRVYNEVVFFVTPHVNWREGVSYRNQYAVLPEPMQWTLAAEDLGGSYDWDFNDVVFTFTDVIRNLKSANKYRNVAMASGPEGATSVRVIAVTPRAAGGTMPIYITYTGKNVMKMPQMPDGGDTMFSVADAALKEYLAQGGEDGTFVLGTEVHKWLGAATHTKQINVGTTRRDMGAEPVEFVIPTNLELGEETLLDYSNAVSDHNVPLYGFAVLVDKDDELKMDTFNDSDKGYRRMPSLAMGEGAYLIGKPSADQELTAPQMFLVEGDWEWPTERTNILEAYPEFGSWIQDPVATTEWHKNKNNSKVTCK